MATTGKAKYLFSALASTVIWGFFALPLRNLRAWPSEQILCYRIFTSLLIIWLVIAVFRRKQLRSDLQTIRNLRPGEGRKLAVLTLLSGLLITGNWYTFIYAVNNVSLKSAAFAYMVCPLITALGGYFILREALSRVKFIALAVAFVSILLLATGSLVEVTWSVVIAALYAFYLIIQRKINQVDKFNFLGVQMLLSVFLMLPLFVSQYENFPVSPVFWFNILAIAVIFTIIPLFLSLYALLGIQSSTLGIIIYLNPIIAFAVAFVYFGEKITVHQMFAYGLLLLAVLLFNLQLIKDLAARRRGHGGA
ncbi:permease [Pedobacter yulinensis]|uniref:Permease n=1 Tax=Pedobacter yulinensis TaxID=2126353 RepID=A0A2T3HR53_9SPHI|nr:EamA family transporter [Pedobacter yulinensis]PST84867.1 permease [Pedobacter yulinensis]